MTDYGIPGNRRLDRRYEIQLEVRWKLIRRRKVLESGTGHTIDVSSGGIRFDAGRELVPGLEVELSISWPVRLHNMVPIQLLVTGRIERVAGTQAAVRLARHEFRTVGAAPDRRNGSGQNRVSDISHFTSGSRFTRLQ
jgi:hypothetical protein